jgi:hypothetical protein
MQWCIALCLILGRRRYITHFSVLSLSRVSCLAQTAARHIDTLQLGITSILNHAMFG